MDRVPPRSAVPSPQDIGDGDTRWTLISVSSPTGISNVHPDQSQKPESTSTRSAASLTTEAELAVLYQSVPIGMALFDRDLRCQRASDTLLASFGLPSEPVAGRALEEAFPGHAAQIAPHLSAVLQSGQRCGPFQTRSENSVVGSGSRNLDLHFYPVVVGSDVVSVVMLADKPYTPQLVDELQRKNHELEEYAHVASHDLQEPLRAITGYCDALREDFSETLDGEASQYLEFVLDGARRMKRMIDDLLDYSRVGREQHLERVDLNDVMTDVRWQMSEALEETQARLDCDGLPNVSGDKIQLTHLFRHLISNGLKFRREGVRPQMQISAAHQEGKWCLSVKDNGIGLEMDHSQRIFQVFQRLHTRRKYSGTGIGLALCRKIVEGHGGRIFVESTPGEGSTFRFTLADVE